MTKSGNDDTCTKSKELLIIAIVYRYIENILGIGYYDIDCAYYTCIYKGFMVISWYFSILVPYHNIVVCFALPWILNELVIVGMYCYTWDCTDGWVYRIIRGFNLIVWVTIDHCFVTWLLKISSTQICTQHILFIFNIMQSNTSKYTYVRTQTNSYKDSKDNTKCLQINTPRYVVPT